MNPTSQPYNGGPDSAHPSTADDRSPAIDAPHEATVSKPESGDDPGEFGIGILPNPKARYWQGRAAFWRNEAIARGYKITEEPDPPGDVGQLSRVDERARQILRDQYAQTFGHEDAYRAYNGPWRMEEDAAIRAITRALSESAGGSWTEDHTKALRVIETELSNARDKVVPAERAWLIDLRTVARGLLADAEKFTASAQAPTTELIASKPGSDVVKTVEPDDFFPPTSKEDHAVDGRSYVVTFSHHRGLKFVFQVHQWVGGGRKRGTRANLRKVWPSSEPSASVKHLLLTLGFDERGALIAAAGGEVDRG